MIGMDESDSSGSDIELEEAKPRNRRPEAVKSGSISAKEQAGKKADGEGEDEDGDEDEDDEDIPVSDLEDLPDEDKEDLIRHTRLTINNTAALTASRIRIAIPTDSSAAFATHMSITSSKPTADAIPDISNDLDREQAFHAQALEAVKQARQLLKKEGVPLTRPNDYFAEMVKDDGHMERVKTKLVEEATAKKASAEARKLRDLKKFGKQVQVAKLQERHKAKRETLEKVKLLKRSKITLKLWVVFCYFVSMVADLTSLLQSGKSPPMTSAPTKQTSSTWRSTTS
jgi:rRNA-processing protein EBP2